jgi:hypothetical protein
MVEGEKRRFWIPADLAYGENFPAADGPGGLLVFDVGLGISRLPRLPSHPPLLQGMWLLLLV